MHKFTRKGARDNRCSTGDCGELEVLMLGQDLRLTAVVDIGRHDVVQRIIVSDMRWRETVLIQ